MAKIITDSQHYTDIAAAIREKNGTETAYKPSEMAEAIQSIQSGGADFSEVEYKLSGGYTNYSYYFYNHDGMTEVPSEIIQHTSNATIFGNMFSGCEALTSIPYLDTSNGTDFGTMFSGCRAITSIPNLDTSKGTEFDNMFNGCYALTSVPNLDTSNGTDFRSMFHNCKVITSIPNLDTSNGKDFTQMFYYCYELTSAPEIDTSKGTSFTNMFNECRALVTIPKLDLSSNTKTFSGVFAFCAKLENITFVGTIKASGLALSASTLLTHDSIMSAINALYDYAAEGSTSTYKLTLGTTNLAKLTDAEKAIATQKGWTLA